MQVALPTWLVSFSGHLGPTWCLLTSFQDPALSWDYNRNRSDPAFKADAYHGTKCAGVIAMVANNSLCGVGVAFDSKVGGVTLLNGVVTDGIEAQALSHEAEK